MLKKLSLLLFSGGILALSLFYWLKPPKGKPVQETLPIIIEAKAIKESQLPETLHALGNTASQDKVDISPEISGQIANILFIPGSYVNKGTPLIELSNSLYKSELTVAQSNFELSKLNLSRTKTLNEKNLTSNQELDNAKALFEEQKSALTAKQEALSKSILKAPFSGVLGEKKISVGQYVTIGTPLVSLNAIDTIKVKYNLNEEDLGKLRLGQAVKLKSHAFPEKTFEGKLTYISPTVNPTTHMVEVEAEVDNPKKLLTAGLFVEISQHLNDVSPSILIPEEALIPTLEGQSVFIVKNNKAYAKPIEIGEHFDGQIVVKAGLKNTDLVVTRGQHKLKDGSLIKVKS